jgi:hypothetical protein
MDAVLHPFCTGLTTPFHPGPLWHARRIAISAKNSGEFLDALFTLCEVGGAHFTLTLLASSG